MGKLITPNTRNDGNNSPRVGVVDSNVQRDHSHSFSTSKSEGNIDVIQQLQLIQQQKQQNLMRGSGGITKDMLHTYRNAPVRPSNALSGSTGMPLNPTTPIPIKPTTTTTTGSSHNDGALNAISSVVPRSNNKNIERNKSPSSRCSTPTNLSGTPPSPKSVMHSVEVAFTYVLRIYK
jgi:hypothetical protein